MVKDYSKRSKKRTRLTKLEEKRSIKQALFFSFLTIILVFVLIYVGIPGLIKMITFLGDIRSSGQKIETSDTLPPTAPILQPLLEATNSSKIDIKGFAENGAVVKLVLNGVAVKEVVAGKDGGFIFTNIRLKQGKNKIKAKAIDSSGNESPFSQELLVSFDNKPPELEITSPKNEDEFFDKEKEIKVEGKSEPDITVFINERLTITNSEGKFSTILELKEGKNEIRVKAKDKAGNETVEEIKVTYTP